jgi:hypothetical protein
LSSLSSSTAKSSSPAKKSSVNGEELSKPSQEKSLTYDRPVPGTTIRCLDDPGINSPPTANPRSTVNPTTVEIVDKARDRFDRFWNPNDGPK